MDGVSVRATGVFQGTLLQALQQIFPAENIATNVRKDNSLKSPISGLPLEIDVWLPDYKICFEFQDTHHYVTTWYSQYPLSRIQIVDYAKREIIVNKGETLIEIPCWWDGSIISLATTILFYRPDLAHVMFGGRDGRIRSGRNSDRDNDSDNDRDKERDADNDGRYIDDSENEGRYRDDSENEGRYRDDSGSEGRYRDDSGNEETGIVALYHQHLIGLNPVDTQFKEFGVPGIGELMAASFPTMTSNFAKSISDENYWWLGEKYDGIRACWNPYNKAMYSRYGLQLNIPPSCTTNFMDVFFESEIWFGRGLFTDTQRIVTAEYAWVDWAYVRFVAFDIPEIPKHPFEKRYERLLEEASRSSAVNVVVASRNRCTSQVQLLRSLKGLVDFGGEGVIMRRPASSYFKGRSTDLIKLKATRGDMEGLVVRVKRNYIRLQLPNGSFLNVDNADVRIPNRGSTGGNADSDISTDPIEPSDANDSQVEVEGTPQDGEAMIREGMIVSFTYTMTAQRNQPAQPVVYRIRHDLHWRDVLRSFRSENNALSLNEVSQRVGMGTEMIEDTANNHRDVEKKIQMRAQLEFFARSQQLDPLQATTWYKLSKKPTLLKESCKIPWNTVFKGSVVKAVMSLFPELSFIEEQFAIAPRHHWFSIQNRRDFFSDFAKDQKFDSLVADHWYNHSADSLRSFKGADGLLRHFEGNYAKALVHTFPEIGLDENKLYRRYWLDTKNQQEIFIQFAQKNGFSAFSADSWYSVHPDTFHSSKNVSSVLQFYDGSYSKALVHLFPNIGLQEEQLQAYWGDHIHRKQMFSNFAKERGCSPTNADDWYKMDLTSLILQKGIGSVLKFYDGSISRALTSLFPNIGLDETKLKRRYWLDVKNKQQIFINFAHEKKFDHLNPRKWYEADLTQVPIPMKPHSLANHRLQCVKLLLHLFPDIGLDKAKFNIGIGKIGLDMKERHEFFVNFSKERGFDPLIADNWYSISNDDLFSAKGGRSVATRYGGSFSKALLHVFPNIGLQHNKLSNRSLLIWRDVENKRKFFENIAKDKAFDPLVASNWYSLTQSEILEYKGARSILPQYNGSFIEALESLFDFEFDESKFAVPEYKYWKVAGNRKKFFDEFAKENGNDPLQVHSWYFTSLQDILAKQGGEKLLRFYDRNINSANVITALQSVYPDLEFNINKFVVLNPNYWLHMDNRKQLFESYAAKYGFDSLVAENWYSIDPKSIMSMKGADTLLIDRPSIVKNLLRVFQDIGLDKTKFQFLPGKYWITNQAEHIKELFLQFASEKGFDPLDPNNWYSLSEEEILAHPSSRELISYQKSFGQSIVSVFPDIGLQHHKFPHSNTSKLVLSPKGYWNEVENQRIMFETFALKNGFDPLVAENWYSKTFESLANMKGKRIIQDQHKLLSTALQHAFPHVSFEPSKFRLRVKRKA